MAISIDEKILKKELEIDKLKEQISERTAKLSEREKELATLNKEKDLENLFRVKKCFNNEEDVDKFLEAVGNKDIESIKKLLDIKIGD